MVGATVVGGTVVGGTVVGTTVVGGTVVGATVVGATVAGSTAGSTGTVVVGVGTFDTTDKAAGDSGVPTNVPSMALALASSFPSHNVWYSRMVSRLPPAGLGTRSIHSGSMAARG